MPHSQRHHCLPIARRSRQRVDRRIAQHRDAVRTRHVLIHTFQIHIGPARQRIVRLQHELIPLWRDAPAVVAEMPVGERVRAAQRERRCNRVARIQFVVVEGQHIAVERGIRTTLGDLMRIVEHRSCEDEANSRRAERIAARRAEDALARAGKDRVAVAAAHRAAGIAGLIDATRLVHLQIGQRQIERTAGPLRAEAIGVVVAETAGRIAERISTADREAVIRRAAEFQRIVHAQIVIEVVVIEGMVGDIAAETRTRCRKRRDEINEEVILPAHRHGAPLFACDTDPRLTAEFVAAIGELAAVDIKTVLQVEDRAQSAAQVFVATQAPAVGTDIAALHHPVAFAARGRFLIADVVDARIEGPVERDTALRVRRRTEGACQRDERGYQCFIHV
ncbi:hypothetical protein KCU90_g5401, partial [Aureobasidium melanogenum]